MSDSALLDRLHAERKRIRATWQLVPAPVVVPLPLQPEKPLSERIAEAKKLRGTVSKSKFHAIISTIYSNARKNGEYVTNVCKKLPEEIGTPTIIKIQTVVADYYNITRTDMLSFRGYEQIILPRQIAMYLSRFFVPYSLTYIGDRFGHDHSTVRCSVKKIKKMIDANPVFAEEIETLKKMVIS